jgi:hypothetical protein
MTFCYTRMYPSIHRTRPYAFPNTLLISVLSCPTVLSVFVPSIVSVKIKANRVVGKWRAHIHHTRAHT